jgi:ABC-type polysaccharide/polyol phosphate transport system ATPase subunit
VTELAVEVRNMSKAFRLPHQRQSSIKERFMHPLQKVEYEQNHALHDVSFTVERGECFGVIGPNGSGKSTLVKILGGIYRADAGTVRVAGRLSPFVELGVGFHPDLNARDNIRINGMLLGLSPKEVAERFDEIVGFAELERFVDQKLKNFSSGMHVRLAFSIAIQVPFDILLLDEVLAVGDQAFQEKCFATFERFRDERKTIVFISHDLRAVSTYCDRAMLLESGVCAALGPAHEVVELYERPRAGVVAG